ncbi:hypothetical protein BT96DRAFT_988303 [Gymnopus androsaceus JB14]|uniref:non-specific serine/threonine protein kinase n=1 Tax=Gymnopus androsaceus JB14 TaxID=1447944 RepID=A0A6A4I4V2_9AGAR|nr:hypothetical protein BT96DRAFT_988303 [Gymnopus androsaceus JB14]
MGQSGSTLTRTTGALDTFINELGGEILYEKSLGSARFLKTVKCRHQNGYLVVKVFIKPDPGLSLRNYHRRLKIDREALLDIVNVYNYQAFVETEKAGYIIRQWIASNLYDRISTRPFLSVIEKKWIAFQVLTGLRDARNRKVSHGDIKSENILVTSWNWVYLSDFASYKPTFLPLDDPSDFSFFFDTSGRRTCYIAPERFYTAASNPEISAKKSSLEEGRRDGKVTEAMDCFSVGCVIAELFLEGAPLFTLSQLFKYREGEYNVDPHLNMIEDEGVRNMIKEMINLDPSARPTFDSLLHSSRGTVFPESFFSFLHNYVSSINELPGISPFAPSISSIVNAGGVNPPASATGIRNSASTSAATGLATNVMISNDLLPSDSDHRMERLWADFESVEPYLFAETGEETVMDVKVDYYTTSASVSRPFQDILPIELHIPNRESKLNSVIQPGSRATVDGPALIILALVTANIRNCSLPSSKVRALDVFLALSSHLTDEAKLDRMVPYIVDLLHDERCDCEIGSDTDFGSSVITPSNAAIFPEYIIPNIRYLVQDPEVSVRCTYAQCIVQFADTAVRYLEMGQALKAHGSFKLSPEAQEYDIYEQAFKTSKAPSKNNSLHFSVDSSSIVKRAVLHHISYLCIFLGRQRTNDVLLSHMITYLNDRDWLLRHAFFESIVDVAACAGGRSLGGVYPTVDDSGVVLLGLFQKMRIWELMSATLGFLYHPNIWIRQGAAAFIASAAKHLPPSDVWCILYPSLRHFLKSDVAVIDEKNLLNAMKPALARQIFDAAVLWARKTDKSSFWKGGRRSGGGKAETPRESVASVRKVSTSLSKNLSEEDEAQVVKLQQMGMTSTEEAKADGDARLYLEACECYIEVSAIEIFSRASSQVAHSFSTRSSGEQGTDKHLKNIGDVELPKLGVVPQTVFLKVRRIEFSCISFFTSFLRYAREGIFTYSPLLNRFFSDQISTTGPPTAGAPFEDLRRRLATINGSASSLSLAPQAQATPRSTLSPIIPQPSSALASGAISPDTIDRPASPTESVVSTSNSTSFRPLSRMQIGGSVSGEGSQKAAPAVGSSKTNALGLLDTHSHLRTESSPERSGRTTPLSMSQTIRPLNRPRVPSMLPISTYDGQEAGISNLLENLYLDNNRELQHDFGPRVHEGPVRRRNPVRHSFVSRDARTSDAITGLAVSPDHTFFVSASDDKTVKVWDTGRLERNVTAKPRHTYTQHHARVKCVCILEGVHCFASAADDGSLHIVRVHISQHTGALPKYNKLQLVREHRVDTVGEYITAMQHYNTDASSNLVYATTHSVITILDLRTMRVLQKMENPRQYGPITCLCIDRRRSWILVGTSTGVLTLWDRRFGLLLKSWHVGVASIGRLVRIHQCVVHPSKGRGKWVMVTIETSKANNDRAFSILVEVWDIGKSLLVETFVVRKGSGSDDAIEPHGLIGVDADTTPSAAIAALVRSHVRALVVGMEFGGHSTAPRSDLADFTGEAAPSKAAGRGFMITASEDRKIRLWDLGKIERSTVLCGVETEIEKPTYSVSSNGSASTYIEEWPVAGSSSQQNRPTQRISLITHNQQTLLRSHQDIVTALACIDSPFRGGVVSGDRAGVIKVWRVEASE